jgi:hypothetical protein
MDVARPGELHGISGCIGYSILPIQGFLSFITVDGAWNAPYLAKGRGLWGASRSRQHKGAEFN